MLMELVGSIDPGYKISRMDGDCSLLIMLVVALDDTISGSKPPGMMIEIARQVHRWYQENTDTRGMPVLEQCWYQKNADTRGMLVPEQC
jgi:hypothetical protein